MDAREYHNYPEWVRIGAMVSYKWNDNDYFICGFAPSGGAYVYEDLDDKWFPLNLDEFTPIFDIDGNQRFVDKYMIDIARLEAAR